MKMGNDEKEKKIKRAKLEDKSDRKKKEINWNEFNRKIEEIIENVDKNE